MGAKRRNVLRIATSTQARLRVRNQTVRISNKSRGFQILIRDVSPEGMGVVLSEGSQLLVGSSVTVEIKLGALDAELKGRLVWSEGTEASSRAGVALSLQAMDQRTRSAYFNWIARHANAQGLADALRRSVGNRN